MVFHDATQHEIAQHDIIFAVAVTCVYIYIYIHTHTHYIYIYIYIHYTHIHIYIYIYIYIYICLHRSDTCMGIGCTGRSGSGTAPRWRPAKHERHRSHVRTSAVRLIHAVRMGCSTRADSCFKWVKFPRIQGSPGISRQGNSYYSMKAYQHEAGVLHTSV